MTSELMRLRAVFVLGGIVCFIAAGQATAEQCHDMDPLLPDPVWCDDFDQYCLDGQPLNGDGDCVHTFDGTCQVQAGQYEVCGAVVAGECPPDGSNPGKKCTANTDCPVKLCAGGYRDGLTCNNDRACYDYADRDNAAFLGAWPYENCVPSTDEFRLETYPSQTHQQAKGYSVFVTQNVEKLVTHIHDMALDIQNHPENSAGHTGVDGLGVILPRTDENYVDPSDRVLSPDILKGDFYLYGLGTGAVLYNDFYLELYMDDDRAPVNYTLRDCTGDGLKRGPYPILDKSDDTTHRSFAFGLMAIGDTDPCAVTAQGRHMPEQNRAYVYDGKTWTWLKGAVFGKVSEEDDFHQADKWNRFEFYIGSENIEIRLYNDIAKECCETGLHGNDDCSVMKDNPDRYGCGECTQEVVEPGACTDTADGDCINYFCVGGANQGVFCPTNQINDPVCDRDRCGAGADFGRCVDKNPTSGIGTCEGGTSPPGTTCTSDAQCPNQYCDVNDCPDKMATDCTGGMFVALVPRQYEGPFNEMAIGVNSGIDIGAGICVTANGTCVNSKCDAGVHYGQACQTTADCTMDRCVGGMKHDQECVDNGDCPAYESSGCVESVCVGGTNYDNACETDDQCPDEPNMPNCLDAPGNNINGLVLDEVRLYDGIFATGKGACCVRTGWGAGTCELTESDACAGDWSETPSCEEACPSFCPELFADTDGDDDVDQEDFSMFQTCFSGVDVAYTDPNCVCFDRRDALNAHGQDGDIDADDYAAFENCASGPDIPADPVEVCDRVP